MRVVVKSQIIETQLSELADDARRADEFVDGVEWTLARDPQAGICMTPGALPEVWAIPINEISPDLWLFYVFTNERVELLEIHLLGTAA